MKAELVKRQDRWDLYGEDGSKIASSAPNPFKRLSIKNCESIENGYDLDELAKNLYKESLNYHLQHELDYTFGVIDGFQKALEILSDKKFSENDVRDAYYHGEQDSYMKGGLTKQKEDEYIQSLQQTEWDVVIDVLMTEREGGVVIETPKLDADGCLILKRL